MTEDFEELQRGGAVLYGALRGIWVMVLVSKPTKADMLLAGPALTTMARRYPRGFPTVTWVTLSAGMSMESDARKAATDVTNRFTKEILAQATLVEGSGFQAATVRAIIAGLDAVTRSACPKKVFSQLEPALVWSASLLPAGSGRVATAELAKALQARRDAMAAG